MKRPLLAAIFTMLLTLVTAAPSSPSTARARELIRSLKLQSLPQESGYLGIIGRSAQTVTINGRALAVQSQNYYMLTRDRPINYLYWLEPDDTHILIEGGPVDYFIFHPDGRAEKVTLGMNPSLRASVLLLQCRAAVGKRCDSTTDRLTRSWRIRFRPSSLPIASG